MPQSFKDYGRVGITRMYQTIASTGDTTEGVISIPTAGTTNALEIVAQNFKNAFIEGRNEGPTNTSDWVIYATRQFNDSVPATGATFWDVTEDHWEAVDTQANVVADNNITVVELVDKGYTYLVVNITSDVAVTNNRARAILTTY